MNNTDTDLNFDDTGPALPELDAFARRAATDLRNTTTDYTVAAPSSPQRSRRFMLVAAAIAMVLVASGLVLANRDNRDDIQRTITQPESYLFPSYIPEGLRFTGAYDSSVDPLPGIADESVLSPGEKASTAIVYANDDYSKAVAVWAFEQQGDQLLLDSSSDEGTAISGDRITIAGQAAVINSNGPSVSSLVVQSSGKWLTSYNARGMSRTELLKLAREVNVESPGEPELAANSLPKGLGVVARSAPILQLFPRQPSLGLSSPEQRLLAWESKSEVDGSSLALTVEPGDAQTFRLVGLFVERNPVSVNGHDGFLGESGPNGGSKQLVWLQDGTQVQVSFAGLSDAEAIKMAESLEQLTPEQYRERIRSLGGRLGSIRDGEVLIAEGGPPAESSAWRITVNPVDGTVTQRRSTTSSSGTSSQTGTFEPSKLNDLSLDRSESPALLSGSTSIDIESVLVNGEQVNLTKPIGTKQLRYFGLALPDGTSSPTVVARDSQGKEITQTVP